MKNINILECINKLQVLLCKKKNGSVSHGVGKTSAKPYLLMNLGIMCKELRKLIKPKMYLNGQITQRDTLSQRMAS